MQALEAGIFLSEHLSLSLSLSLSLQLYFSVCLLVVFTLHVSLPLAFGCSNE